MFWVRKKMKWIVEKIKRQSEWERDRNKKERKREREKDRKKERKKEREREKEIEKEIKREREKEERKKRKIEGVRGAFFNKFLISIASNFLSWHEGGGSSSSSSGLNKQQIQDEEKR